MPTEPERLNGEPRGAALTIASVAQMTGTTTRALRYYESIGLLSPKRYAGRFRIYDEDDIRVANDIVYLRRLGFPVHDVAAYLDRQSARTAERQKLLESIRDRLKTNAAEREFLTGAIWELSYVTERATRPG